MLFLYDLWNEDNIFSVILVQKWKWNMLPPSVVCALHRCSMKRGKTKWTKHPILGNSWYLWIILAWISFMKSNIRMKIAKYIFSPVIFPIIFFALVILVWRFKIFIAWSHWTFGQWGGLLPSGKNRDVYDFMLLLARGWIFQRKAQNHRRPLYGPCRDWAG